MPNTVSPTESAVFKALGDFLANVAPAGTEIVQAQDNRVPEPRTPNFVTMNLTRQARLGTNLDQTPAGPTPSTLQITQETMVSVQLDVHGPLGADNSNIISTLLRDDFAVSFFETNSPGITPLYNEDPRQIPFINPEQQYEDRWIVDVHLQVNPTVVVPQDYADTLTIDVVNVEASFPP
jgi:hypothetical protein